MCYDSGSLERKIHQIVTMSPCHTLSFHYGWLWKLQRHRKSVIRLLTLHQNLTSVQPFLSTVRGSPKRSMYDSVGDRCHLTSDPYMNHVDMLLWISMKISSKLSHNFFLFHQLWTYCNWKINNVFWGKYVQAPCPMKLFLVANTVFLRLSISKKLCQMRCWW